MPDWERYTLLTLLGPILWLQGKYVRHVTPRLPEPAGSREGVAGQGPLVRLLVAGDSAAAGVGVSTQDQALCGQLVRQPGQRRTVEWRLIAVNGLDSPGLAKLLGRWAREVNRLPESCLAGHALRTMHWYPPASPASGWAAAGFHPGPYGYTLWAEGLSRHILSVRAPSRASGSLADSTPTGAWN